LTCVKLIVYPSQVSSIGPFNKSLPPPDSSPVLTAHSSSVAMLKEQLINSLRLRVLNIPQPPLVGDASASKTRVAVLFSGGLDCTVLARLAHEVLDPGQGIDLINVAFENPRVIAQLKKDAKGELLTDFYELCPDRITGRKSFAELENVCPGRTFRFLAVGTVCLVSSCSLAHVHQGQRTLRGDGRPSPPSHLLDIPAQH